MHLSRRVSLQLGGALLIAGGTASGARAAPVDPRLTPRTLGKPDAPLQVTEFYSLTCVHCAAFSRTVMPRIRTELIDTGKVGWTFADYPLDRAALAAAMVARSLPPERYDSFTANLLASQDSWAFRRDANPIEELWKRAALAGMPRAQFDATIADTALQNAVFGFETAAQADHKVVATPTFLLNGGRIKDRRLDGEQTFEAFSTALAEASA